MTRTSIPSAVLVAVLAGAVAAQAPDGRQLFATHCAVCHGATGEGDGPGAGKPPPRDLTSGKFSFGTTREAITRTVRGGIAPGMPAFDATLRDDQIDAVVAWVQSLMPAAVEAPAAVSAVTVDAAARVVHGTLPVRGGWKWPVAHGLYVGLPGGWTVEYRTDEFAPLRAFHGEFVDRADWRGRGGSPLEPLGEVRQAFAAAAPLARLDGGAVRPVALRFGEVGTHGARVELHAGFDLDLDGGGRGTWIEDLAPVATPRGGGYRRAVELRTPGADAEFLLRLAGGFPPGGALARSRSLRHTTDWFARSRADGRVDVLAVRRPHGPRSAFAGPRGDVAIAVAPAGRPAIRVETVWLDLDAFDASAAQDLDRELLR